LEIYLFIHVLVKSYCSLIALIWPVFFICFVIFSVIFPAPQIRPSTVGTI